MTESFASIHARAAARKGGEAALEALLFTPKSAAELEAIGDDRWLSGMTKAVFQAGFVWRVVEQKWPGFEAAFDGFDPHRVAQMTDEDLEALLKNPDIIRNGAKVMATRDNAGFILELAAEHGSAAKCFARWPNDDYVGLLNLLKKRAKRLGGQAAQYFLRSMGRDGFVLGKDGVRALIAVGVVDKEPTSQRDLAAVQAAYAQWQKESGRPLAHISKILACSVDD